MPTTRGTMLSLCLEDSTLRIQNRLFEITEDAPAKVHFCTESLILGRGLEGQLKAFLAEHPDTVLVIIDMLQMVRGVHCDNAYANDYRDLSALKRIADGHGIALLLSTTCGRNWRTTCSAVSPVRWPWAARWIPASLWCRTSGAAAE